MPTWATHVQRSELCATCHTLFTTALDAAGEVDRHVARASAVSGVAAQRLPRRRTAARAATCRRSPPKRRSRPCSVNRGRRVAAHVPRRQCFMLTSCNRYRGELGVTALPQELDAAVAETTAFLAARGGTLTIDDARSDAADGSSSTSPSRARRVTSCRRRTRRGAPGCTSPCAIASGRTRLRIGRRSARRRASPATTTTPTPTAFRAALRRSTRPTRCRSTNRSWSTGGVTTGLLRGVRFVKDNRLLPRGFDKTTAPDFAVRGAAKDVRFRCGSPTACVTALRSAAAEAAPLRRSRAADQSIAYRWAENLRGYVARETQRFVNYYAENAAASSVSIATDALLVTPP